MISERHRLIIDDLRELSRPLYQHYSRGDFRAAIAAVELLMDAGRLATLPDDQREVQSCYLLLMHVAMRQYDEQAWDCDYVASAIDQLEQPLGTMLGNHQRISTLLQLRLLVDGECGMSLSRAEFEDLRLHPQLMGLSPNIWDSIGLYAYRNGYRDLLEEAFGSLTISPARVMPQESWQRLNLLVQLAAHKATRRDVQEYIRLMRMVPQIEEFRREMLPAILEAGIWDGILEQELGIMQQQACSGDYQIRLERRTGRIRN